MSSRRATLDDPDSTACLLAPALNSLVWLGSLSRCLRAFSSLTMFSDSSASPGVEAARFATLPGRLHTSDSNPDYGTAQQTHASVEYLRTHAGLGQDCSSQAVPTTTSCHNERPSSATAAGERRWSARRASKSPATRKRKARRLFAAALWLGDVLLINKLLQCLSECPNNRNSTALLK